MMIYSQHFFRRKLRTIPSPSCLPIAITFALLSMCIIFIMPQVITGIKVETPKMNTQPIEIYDDFIYTTIYITDDETIFVNKTQSNLNDIATTIKNVNENKKLDELKVFIRANKNVSYNTISNVLQSLNDSGFYDITLVGNYISGIQDYK